MPKFKIETSLYEPVTVEVEGGRIFTSVPLSPQLIKGIQAIEDEVKGARPLDSMETVTRQVALIFGLEAKDIETVDVRILQRILELATEAMTSGRGATIKNVLAPEQVAEAMTPAAAPPDEATAEKNGLRPEGEISQ